jgi:uncharacterized caspase-like protein
VFALSTQEWTTSDDPEYHLCPSDARPNDRHSAISITEILNELRGCQAGLKVVFVDACRPKQALGFQQGTLDANTAVFYSCRAGEEALEHEELQQGVFSYFLNQGLAGGADTNKDGNVLLHELEAFIALRVPEFSRTRLSRSQVPELHGSRRLAAPITARLSPKPN